MTREHIWPQWYSTLHPGREYQLESIIGDHPAVYRGTDSLDLQPKVLCGPCNNHWGKDFEEAVRPRLARMTEGRPEMITLPFARQLAVWATLKMMVSEHLVRSDQSFAPFFTQDQGSFLRRKSAPPEELRLWIGHYAGTHHAGWVLSKQSARQLDEDASVGIFRHSVTYSLGQVAFQLIGFRLFPLTEGQESRRIGFYNRYSIQAPWREALSRIWPLPEDRFPWPPKKAMDDRAFDASAARWHEQKPTRSRKHRPSPKPPKRR